MRHLGARWLGIIALGIVGDVVLLGRAGLEHGAEANATEIGANKKNGRMNKPRNTGCMWICDGNFSAAQNDVLTLDRLCQIERMYCDH